MFAGKPAPVQVTAWGHASGTGLPTIDYLFSDPVAIPNAVRHLFAETIYDLPCHDDDGAAAVRPAGLRTRRSARAASLPLAASTESRKVSDEAVTTWAGILQAIPAARLLLKDRRLDDLSLRASFTESSGATVSRLTASTSWASTSREAHLAALEEVDIGLDPFPQNGGISTWEALHMGVPVVAELGNSHPSRLSGAILSSLGMNEWVGNNLDDYHAIALKYAAMPEIPNRRCGMSFRSRIATSAAGNSAAYTKAVEAAYRSMWETYVGTTAAAATSRESAAYTRLG